VKNFFQITELESQRNKAGKRYFEFLRVPAMSVGVYVLPAGATDPQSPHTEDEMYYVLSGRGRMKSGQEDQVVGPGTVIFVAAGVDHHFYEVIENLTVLVFFAPAEKI
jgi:mannose-6-phosphate isomerase-like protein (cupin superfamily)